MDRRRAGSPVYARQFSVDSAPSSPAHPLSFEAANGKRTSRAAAANARLAQVMMRKRPDYDAYEEEEDDSIPSIVGGGGRYRSSSGASVAARNPSPMVTSYNPSLRSPHWLLMRHPAVRQYSPGPTSGSSSPPPKSIANGTPEILLLVTEDIHPSSPPSPLPSSTRPNSRRLQCRTAMDRMRAGSPAYSRQGSGGSSGSGSSSPGMSPGHHRSASASGISGIRRTQNLAAKAANARLAQVMASQAAAEEEEDDLLPARAGAGFVGGVRFGLPRPVPSSNGGGGASLFGRSARSPSPAVIARLIHLRDVEFGLEILVGVFRSFVAPFLGRNIMETASTNRSTSAGRSTLSVRTTPVVPQTKTTIRTPSPVPAIEPPVDRRRDKRFFPDMGHLNSREPGDLREASALQDQLDMLEEENYNLLEKLQLAEERCKEAEARSRELEKQVANLGEGVSLEARHLSRKEAALRQREEAMKAAMRTKDDKDEELTALRQEVQSAKDETANTVDQLQDAELEVKALRSMTHRMILTQEEMEEVVLKRCWLARYWALAVHHGIYPEIAAAKHEYWSSFAPLPLEVVSSAGQKTKDDSWSTGYDHTDRRNQLDRDISDITAEGNIENMLAVEKGLRELASLKVEDAVMLVLAQHRRPNLLRQSASDLRSPGDPKWDEFELSQEEAEDVLFKQSWLTYFWRRAKTHGIEEDIAEEHLRFWIGRMGQPPTSHDVVDVERGLIELRKLGIEQQLWEACRMEFDANQKPEADAENS
ncbi:unnamed protein product [Musa hybrid cultivar]